MALDSISNTACSQPSSPSEPKITPGRFRTRSAPFRLEILSLSYAFFFAISFLRRTPIFTQDILYSIFAGFASTAMRSAAPRKFPCTALRQPKTSPINHHRPTKNNVMQPPLTLSARGFAQFPHLFPPLLCEPVFPRKVRTKQKPPCRTAHFVPSRFAPPPSPKRASIDLPLTHRTSIDLP